MEFGIILTRQQIIQMESQEEEFVDQEDLLKFIRWLDFLLALL
jgi:hypothetical protein